MMPARPSACLVLVQTHVALFRLKTPFLCATWSHPRYARVSKGVSSGALDK